MIGKNEKPRNYEKGNIKAYGREGSNKITERMNIKPY
jgi:hypothetical protein